MRRSIAVEPGVTPRAASDCSETGRAPTASPLHSSTTSPSSAAGRSTSWLSSATGSSSSPRLNAATYWSPSGPSAVHSTSGSSRNTSRFPCESACTERTSALLSSAMVDGSDVGRSPPTMSGDLAITHSVKSVICSSVVSRESRGSPRSARIPIRPRGSMSPSGHPVGPACGAQRAKRAKFASTSSHRSHRSSQIRHIVACSRRWSRRVRDRSRPGERLSRIGRPQRVIDPENASISAA